MVPILKNSLFLLSFCFVLIACSSRGNHDRENTSVSVDATVDLPNITLTKLNGERLQGKDLLGKKSILILFQTDCDHCQREAKQIKAHLQSFSEYQLYFITNASATEVGKFAVDYELSEKSNVIFALTDVQGILNNFGSIPTPSLYIYDAAGKLLRKFNGETDINLILEAL